MDEREYLVYGVFLADSTSVLYLWYILQIQQAMADYHQIWDNWDYWDEEAELDAEMDARIGVERRRRRIVTGKTRGSYFSVFIGRYDK